MAVIVSRGGSDWDGVDVDSKNTASQRFSWCSFSCGGEIRFQEQSEGFSDDSFGSS